MGKHDTCILENISNRRNKWNITYNDYTRDISSSDSLAVYQSGHKKYCPPNFKCGPDMYDHYILHYIIDGTGTYTNGIHSYKVRQGDLFLILPYQAVCYQADSVTPWTYYWVGFNGIEVPNLLNLCGFSEDHLLIHYPEADSLIQYMSGINHLHRTGAAQEYGLIGYLYQIFSLLISTNQTKINTTYADYYYKAIQYIRLNYNDSDLTVSNIASHIGITRTHLYRIFDQQSHQSVQNCITDFRLKKAVMLLENSTSAIGDIALSCGFSDQSHFSSMFKKKYQLSPSQYRKQLSLKM